ncbi:methionyl-tRNA formyltransferase [Buchnera aphidicola]|uniref:methionyl-tRNA formyltransferase n=1 Tax=Buchnera aphidicola TaxID=9 RepID=UPI0031B82B95
MKKKIKKSLKIVFAGTTSFSEKYLKSLIKSNHKIMQTITKKEKIKKNFPSKIIYTSKKYSIPIIYNTNLKDKNIIKKIKKNNPDIMIIVAYGIKIPKEMINIFPLKAINVHPSILPKWKGPAPIQRSILHGDKLTGISIILINNKFDSGKILKKKTCKISKKDTFKSLSKKLCNVGIKSMFLLLKNIFKKHKKYKKINKIKNNLYASKINKIETKLNWKKTAKFLERSVRAFFPKPGTYFIYKKKRIKVTSSKEIILKKNYLHGEIVKISKHGICVGTKKNCFLIKKIQFEGKNIINSLDIYNGYKNFFTIGSIIR